MSARSASGPSNHVPSQRQAEPEDAPLSAIQERMMAYLDGELSESDRLAFEAEVATDTELGRELDRFRALMELTDTITLPEPTDHEIRRFWTGFYNRSEWQVGWLLLLSGLAVFAGWGLWAACATDLLPWPGKIALLAIVVGFALLLGNTIRLRQRVARYDRYRGVLR